MCSRGNVQSGKYPLGEMTGWGNVQSGKCRSGNCPVGDVSVGELLVGELSSRGSVRIPYIYNSATGRPQLTCRHKAIVVMRRMDALDCLHGSTIYVLCSLLCAC